MSQSVDSSHVQLQSNCKQVLKYLSVSGYIYVSIGKVVDRHGVCSQGVFNQSWLDFSVMGIHFIWKVFPILLKFWTKNGFSHPKGCKLAIGKSFLRRSAGTWGNFSPLPLMFPLHRNYCLTERHQMHIDPVLQLSFFVLLHRLYKWINWIYNNHT